MKRVLAISALLALSFLAGCGNLSNTGASPSASPPPSASASPMQTATVQPTTTPSPTPSISSSPVPWPPDGFSSANASGGSVTVSVNVVAVRVGAHPGYDRFVIEFDRGVPSYTVTVQQGTRFTLDPSGKTVVLEGSNGVVVTIQHVLNWNSYTGPLSVQLDSAYLKAGRQIQNYEGVQDWGLGIAGDPVLRVFTLTSPPRLVVDITAR